jgi:hypothetical protein
MVENQLRKTPVCAKWLGRILHLFAVAFRHKQNYVNLSINVLHYCCNEGKYSRAPESRKNKGCFCTGSANLFRSTVISNYESFIAWLSVYGDVHIFDLKRVRFLMALFLVLCGGART